LDPNDLFASKLSAWRPKDQLFLRAMLRRRLARPDLVRERIETLSVPKSFRMEMVEILEKLTAAPKRTKKTVS